MSLTRSRPSSNRHRHRHRHRHRARWVQGSEKSKCDVYKWVVATDAETGAEVVSAPSARARTFVPTEPTPAQLKAHQAAMAPSAAVAGGGVAAPPAAPAAKKRRR